MTITLLQGDALSVLATLPAGSVQTVITSPPYYGLRRYTTDPREIGQEAAPDCLAWARREPPCGACFVCALRAVFAAVWRVLRSDGSVWLNLGDSYAGSSQTGGTGRETITGGKRNQRESMFDSAPRSTPGIPDKNLLLIPARVALALQSDGWIVRCDILWAKTNPMPESVQDRPTRAHEYVYLLSKQARYYYDADAIREDAQDRPQPSAEQKTKYHGAMSVGGNNAYAAGPTGYGHNPAGRNRRSVWTIATRPYAGAHFATMPEALIEPCLLAGSSAQACEHCGAAWGRVVERETITSNEKYPNGPGGQQNRNGVPGQTPHHALHTSLGTSTTTLGFAPRCACADNTGAAASTVLDPFAGTFTVGRVAERFGRNAIGIELNPDYTELSDARTNGVQKELFT